MVEIQKERRCPLWVKIALGLSLAVNLAIAGLVAGLVLRGGPLGGKGPGMGYAMPYVIALPPDDRKAVFDAVRGNPDLPGRGARREAYRDMVSILEADSFDRAAVEAVLQRQSRGVAEVQSVAQAAWLDVVERMPDDARKTYAQKVAEVAARGGRGKPRKGE